MFDAKKITIVSLILLVVSIPFIFRERGASIVPIEGVETITIVTAHNDSLRREYDIGFKKWYKQKTGKDVNIDWRYQGGGRDAARYIESMYSNNFRLYWTNELHYEWTAPVASAFASRSEKSLTSDNLSEAEVVRAFFDSDVGCGLDIMFGGGVFEFISQSSRGNLVPCEILFEHPEMFSNETIPESLSGSFLWDSKGRWFGASLSAFGIIYNKEAIIEDGIGFFPETWMDIGRTEFFKKLAVVDPTKSSSTQKAFVMLIQQQMQICYDRLKAERGVDFLDAEDEKNVIAEGWINGLKLIQKIVANGRYFTESATRPIVDVSAGNCLVGISVDFYGFAEAKHLEERSGSKRFKFVMPVAGGAPSPDPIAIFRGAPNPKLAKEFIEFILSLDGQKLLDFDLNTPGGPQKTTMRRMPILKTIYDPKFDEYRCDSSINPYKSSKLFTSHEEWTDEIFNSIGLVIRLAFLDPSAELSDAMEAIIKARREGREYDADRAYDVLSDMSDLTYENIRSVFKPTMISKNILKIIDLQNKTSEKHRKQYILAKKIADGC